jgi:hypothetical protein
MNETAANFGGYIAVWKTLVMAAAFFGWMQIGRASCRERVYVLV